MSGFQVSTDNVLQVYKERLSEETENHVLARTAWLESQSQLAELINVLRAAVAEGVVDLSDPMMGRVRVLIGLDDGAPRTIQAVPTAEEA